MATKYSKVILNDTCGKVMYSKLKGNTIVRQGDTIFIKTDGIPRIEAVPWSAVATSDFEGFCPDMVKDDKSH
jgi:hypothetical protein